MVYILLWPQAKNFCAYFCAPSLTGFAVASSNGFLALFLAFTARWSLVYLLDGIGFVLFCSLPSLVSLVGQLSCGWG